MGSLWNRSGVVERYADDLRASGAKAFFFLGGTTTPLTVYQDAGESSAHPHPVLADADGRWPDIFVPYIIGYDVQVKSAFDVQLTYTQNIPNPDPVDVTVVVPPEETVQTGMIHGEMVNAVKTGYVRLNGRTMGNGASTGTERANADAEDLFVYLWGNLSDTLAPVSTGRGASGAADFAANKTITLPDWRGAMPIGLDDMGNSAGSFFTGLTISPGDAITAGSRTGTNGVTLTIANLATHSHTGTTATEGAHTHTGTTGVQSADHTHSMTTGTATSSGAHTHTVNVNDPGHTHRVDTVGNTNDTGASQRLVAPGVGSLNATGSNTTGITATTVSDGAHTHPISGSTGVQSASHTHSFATGAGSLHSHTFTSDAIGSSSPFNNLPRSVLVTWFIKL